MKKLASTLLPIALVITACGGVNTAPAATVNGDIITVGDVEGLISPQESTADLTTFARFLGAAITLDLFFEAAQAEYGVNPTDDEVIAEADRIYQDNNADQTREEFLAENGVSEKFLQQVARQSLVQTAVLAKIEEGIVVTEEDLVEPRRAAELSLTEVCAAHILVATEEEANDVLARLDAGEEFADIAIELSLDTTSGANGGDLGCSPPSQYVDPFAEATMAAEIGEVTDPVQSEFGYHLILVSDRTAADPADLPTDAQLSEQVKPVLVNEAFEAWINGLFDSADIGVEAAYGTWDPETQSVVPPSDSLPGASTSAPG